MNKLLLGVAAASAMFIASTANAGLILTVTDDVGSTTVSGVDSVSYACGAFGAPACVSADWNVELASALGDSFTSFPSLFDITVQGSSKKASSTALVVELTANDISGSWGSVAYNSNNNQSSGISHTYELWFDATNMGLSGGSAILIGGTQSGSGLDNFSVSQQPLTTAGDYSLTLIATYIADGAGQTISSDTHVKVPEPAVLALFGLGLLGLGFLQRKSKSS